jgi:hypothetical protein
MSAEHLAHIAAQGWTRVDTAPGEWVALVLNIEATGFGGTLWRRADNGNDYAEGVTEGFPISAALEFEPAARAVAMAIKGEASR